MFFKVVLALLLFVVALFFLAWALTWLLMVGKEGLVMIVVLASIAILLAYGGIKVLRWKG